MPRSSAQYAVIGFSPTSRITIAADREREHDRGDRDEDRLQVEVALHHAVEIAPRRLRSRRCRHQLAIALGSSLPQAMSSPTRSRVADRSVELADELAAVEHADAIREREDLVELGGNEEHRGAFVAHLDDATMDELDRSDVEAARRLRDEEHLDATRELAGDDHLLLVPTRERLDRLVRMPEARTSNRRISSSACSSIAAQLADQPARERLRGSRCSAPGCRRWRTGRRRRACCGLRGRGRPRAR